MLIVKVRKTAKPEYFVERIKSDCKYDTRRSRQELIQWGPDFRAKKTLTFNSWRWYGSSNFNMLPHALRKTDDIKMFKSQLISWIRANIPL